MRGFARSGSRWRLSLGVLCAGVVAVLPLTADARPAVAHHEYNGYLVGDPQVRSISLEVRRRGETNVRALFKVEDLELICDGGLRRRTFGPDRLNFMSSTVFQVHRYERLGDGNWSYYEVKGRLLGDGRAKGYVYYLQDSYGAADTASPECNTGGQLYLRWRAGRTGR